MYVKRMGSRTQTSAGSKAKRSKNVPRKAAKKKAARRRTTRRTSGYGR